MPVEMIDKEREAQFKRSLSKQMVLGLLTNFSSIAPSMSLGFSSVALPILAANLNESKLSWFASVASLATPFGCFFSGPVADRFGRRTSILLVNAVCFLGWIAVAAACYVKTIHFPLLIMGRLFTGFSTGLCSSPATIYMAEVSSPNLIGVFTVWPSVFFSAGILFIYLLGLLLKERLVLMSLLTCLLPVMGMLFTIFMVPESPSWLVGKNRISEAKVNMCKIFGTKSYNSQVQSEIEGLLRRKGVKINMEKKPLTMQIYRKLQFALKPYCRKPLLIVLAFFFFQQTAGVFAVLFYAIDIVQNAGIVIDPYLTIVVIASVRLLTSILTSLLSRRFGKRPLSLLSGILMGMCLFALVAFLNYQEQGFITNEKLNILPLILLILYFITSILGFVPIPFALAAELFPVKIKGLASGVASGWCYLFNFIMVKIYPDMIHLIGAKGVFGFYGAMGFLGTIFVYFVLPETRGKTLQEIEEYFGKKPNSEEGEEKVKINA